MQGGCLYPLLDMATLTVTLKYLCWEGMGSVHLEKARKSLNNVGEMLLGQKKTTDSYLIKFWYERKSFI